jgi:3-hydroxyacyl-[acyl-carrier-protein] dehydratase
VRFLLFDRVTRLDPGRRVEGVKCVSLAEACFDGHFDRAPLFPGSLVLESMVQLLGFAVIHHHGFSLSAILSVLEDATVPERLGPGVRLDLGGEILGTNPKGSVGRAWADVDGTRVASIGRVIYAHLPYAEPGALRARFEALGLLPGSGSVP